MDTFMTPFEAPNNSAIPSSSNTSGLFLPGNILVSQPFETPEPLPVEKLQMADLMKNPIVQELFSTVMENAAYQKKLFQQVNSLQAELASLKEVTARREPVVECRHHQNLSPESISPSDSISQRATSSMPSTSTGLARQVPYRAGQATRPAHYPQSIIWNLEDCKLYPGIVTETNLSRPAMEKCIRHEDGTEITPKEWHTIKASARFLVKMYLTTLKPPADPSAKTRTKTKTYYSKYFPQVWSDVLEKLEDKQPLVGLCASHWKAEHILANCLQANIDNEKKKKKASTGPSPPSEGHDNDQLEQDDMDIEVIPASSKRGAEETTLPEKKKQRTKKSTAATLTRKDKETPPPNPILPAIGTSGVSFERQLSSLGSVGPEVAPSKHVPQLQTDNTVDISFIYVDTKYLSLKDELAQNFPLIQNADDLLDAMASHPQFGGGNPSDNLLNFLMRIETADPNSTDFSEDDTNASWGHSQFTAGNLTWSTVLTSWSDVGNCGVACKLIAAAIKTCKVARHLCFERQISPGSYLSDIYLEQIVEALWRLWKDAGGPILKSKKSANRAVAPPTAANLDTNGNEDSQEIDPRPTAQKNPSQASNTSDTAKTGPAFAGETDHIDHIGLTDQPATNGRDEDAAPEALKDLEKLLQSKNVVKEELKSWIKVNNIGLTSTNKQPTKPAAAPDLISAILKDSRCMAQPAAVRLEFQKMLDERKEGKKTSSKTST